MNTRRFWKVTLQVRGIKGRDRTIKTHSVNVAEFPDDGGPFNKTVSNELIESAMRPFKIWSRAFLIATPVEVQRYDDVSLEQRLYFNTREVKVEVVRRGNT